MKTKGALLWEPGTNSGWSVEEIELDEPNGNEVLVRLAASGICHSDDHLDTGDIPLEWAPALGGHEGAGVIEKVGPGVSEFEVGDHVVFSFLPACGKCIPCVEGEQNLCDLGAAVLGGLTLEGDHRIHANGQGVGAMCLLGTFAEYVVAPLDSVIRIDKAIPLDKAALLGCGVPTGWGSSVYAAETQIGDTVVVCGVGGVGINAVQGAKFAGASQIVAVDPVEFKREKSLEFGATHTASSLEEALPLVEEITNGRLADRSIMTMGVLDTQLMAGMEALTRKGGTMVNTSAPPAEELNMSMSMFSLTMFGKRLQGALFGNCAPRRDVPMLLDLYMRGDLMLDELVTRTYELEEINDGIRDMREGRNLRGLIVYN